MEKKMMMIQIFDNYWEGGIPNQRCFEAKFDAQTVAL